MSNPPLSPIVAFVGEGFSTLAGMVLDKDRQPKFDKAAWMRAKDAVIYASI